MATANLLQTSVSGGVQNALSLQGDGVFFPKASTTSRLALTLTTADKGFLVYDTTDSNIYFWNGTAWESVPSSGDAGANGAVQYNDAGIVSGATNFVWDDVNNRVGIGTATPAEKLTIDNTLGVGAIGLRVFANDQSNARIGVQNTNGQAYHLVAGNPGASNAGFALFDNTAAVTRLYVDNTGVQTWQNVAGVAGTAMTLNANGLGIGFTPSLWGNNNKVVQVGQAGSIYGRSNLGYYGTKFNLYNDNTNDIAITSNFVGEYRFELLNGSHVWLNKSTTGTINVAQTLTQAMTLDASGNLVVGATSALGSRLTVVDTVNNAIVGKNTTALSGVFVAWNAATALDNVFMAFGTETAFTGRGSISYNRAGGLVAYNTTSDYRSKDIIGPVSNSGSLIDSLKVYLGKMKGATIARPMLIAHEAQEVAPYSVTGLKDEVDADGKDKYQQMDVSSFVPLLIAEIQSLRTRVQTLEAR